MSASFFLLWWLEGQAKVFLDGFQCGERMLVQDELTNGPFLGIPESRERRKLTFPWGASRSFEAIATSTPENHQFSDIQFVPSPEKKRDSIIMASFRKWIFYHHVVVP